MSKNCARCDKTVYPIEELKCLDKVWHKGCFKCQQCGMTLSMKTYKGFNKLPYCEAHIPKAKATAVAETPEMKRLAENTKIQSNVLYHADFEKNKAKFTQVADDPETKRIKENTKIISNVSYHGELEKKAVMEKKRSDESGPENDEAMTRQNEDLQYFHSAMQQKHVKESHHLSQHHMPQGSNLHQTQSAHQFGDGMIQSYGSNQDGYAQQQQQQQQQQQHFGSSQAHHQQSMASNYYNNVHAYHNAHHNMPQQNYYQDANHNSPYSTRNSQTLIYSSQTGPVQQSGSSKPVGSIADYDPVNDQYGSISQKRSQGSQGAYRQETTYQVQRSNLYPDGSRKEAVNSSMQYKVNAPPTQIGRCFRAMYDYEAADRDEVSFCEGDLLVNCASIDEGWMTGTVQRTGQTGMLPANYVERVK